MMTIAVELFILFCFPIFALSHKPNIVLIITDDQDSLMNGMVSEFIPLYEEITTNSKIKCLTF